MIATPPDNVIAKSELDPEFRKEDGSIDQEKYLKYLQKRNTVVQEKVKYKDESPLTYIENLWYFLVIKIMNQCRWIKASEYRMWPSGKFPTELPYWQYRFLSAYLTGYSDAEYEKLDKGSSG